MKRIPLDASAVCTDGSGGRSLTVIINPETHKLTHFVVEDREDVKRLVPVEQVESTTRDEIRLRCTKVELAGMDPFIGSRFIEVTSEVQAGATGSGASFAYQAPFAAKQRDKVRVEEEQIPKGEFAIHRGAGVAATDGQVGKVGGFLTDAASGEIRHLVLMKGHLWGKKEISIPASTIQFVTEDLVYLELDKRAVGELPEIPVE